MPNDVSSGNNGGRIDLQSAPGGDLNWDELFPNPEVQPAGQPQASQPGTNLQQQPQAPFLQAGSTVYNTAEDAVKGVSHKDELIAKYRTFLSENKINPDTFQKVAPPQAQPQANEPVRYSGNPQFYDAVADAAQRGDKVAYEKVMAQHQQELIQQTLSPYQPLLAEVARQRAVRQVTSEIPDFQRFVESPDFKRTVDALPLYGEMIQIGENNPEAAARLPEVYKAVYLSYQGLRTPTQGSQGQPQAAQPNTPTVGQRQPTLSHSSLTPPVQSAPTANWAQPQWSGAKQVPNEGRRQLIEDGNAKFGNTNWNELGL